MTTLAKFDELVGEAFVNAMRLHLDSIILSKNGSYASAQLLALEASHEIAQTVVLEHLLTQSVTGDADIDQPAIRRSLADTFTSQVSMRRQLSKTMKHLAKDATYRDMVTLLDTATKQINDEDRHNLTYVSLTRKDRKVNLDGKKIIPRLTGRKDRAQRIITANNDFLMVYIKGYIAGVFPVTSDALAWEMSEETLNILQMEWMQVGRKAKQLLKRYEYVEQSSTEAVYAPSAPAVVTDDSARLDDRPLVVS